MAFVDQTIQVRNVRAQGWLNVWFCRCFLFQNMAKERDLIEDALLEIIATTDGAMGLMENLEEENRPMLLDVVTVILTLGTKLENLQWTVERSVPVQLIDLLYHRH
jgi:hypothetical protein